jgi:hypothetical protein
MTSEVGRCFVKALVGGRLKSGGSAPFDAAMERPNSNGTVGDTGGQHTSSLSLGREYEEKDPRDGSGPRGSCAEIPVRCSLHEKMVTFRSGNECRNLNRGPGRWSLYQLHPGGSGGLVRHHGRSQLNTALCQFPLRSNGGRCLRVLMDERG